MIFRTLGYGLFPKLASELQTRVFTQQEFRKKDCFSVHEFCGHCDTIFEAMGYFYHFCESQELQPGLTNEDILKGRKKREMDNLRRSYWREKNYSIVEM